MGFGKISKRLKRTLDKGKQKAGGGSFLDKLKIDGITNPEQIKDRVNKVIGLFPNPGSGQNKFLDKIKSIGDRFKDGQKDLLDKVGGGSGIDSILNRVKRRGRRWFGKTKFERLRRLGRRLTPQEQEEERIQLNLPPGDPNLPSAIRPTLPPAIYVQGTRKYVGGAGSFLRRRPRI